MAKKRILVTGGTGYIGRALVMRLAKDPGVEHIRLIVRDPTKLSPEIRASKKIGIVIGDMRDSTMLRQSLSGTQLAYHLAAMTPPIPETVSHGELFAANAQTTVALARLAAEQEAERFIYMSATALYGSHAETTITEKDACFPVSGFERSKREGELGIMDLARNSPMEVVILRPSNVIGERQPRRRLLNLMQAIQRRKVVFTNPSGWHNLVYVGDLAEAALRLGLLESPLNSPAIYNVNCPIALDQLVGKLSGMLGLAADFPRIPLSVARGTGRLSALLPGPFSIIERKISQLVDCRIYDSTRLQTVLPGWPFIGLDIGLERTVEDYRQSGWI